MSEMFNLVAKLTLDTSDFDKKTDDAKQQAGMFADVLKANLVGDAIKAAFDGLKQLGGAVVDFTKSAVDGYAQYEQLSGGISKLFGTAGQSIDEYAASQGKSVDEVRESYEALQKAQNDVFQNAKDAYKTAGVSANEYMEQVSSFSAALVNSLGGDTVAAADKADVAMRAISDNVNTFGTDIGSVQTAFQGFAKQNYTMLDNLKLGYGGTKSEMERLIEDANEYGESIGMAGDLSIDSFADIVTAIDLVQQKQGIAGTTARESASTIEGSVNATKAAWENLVAGIANPDADLGELIGNVAESAGIAFDNIVPVVVRALDGIGKAVQKTAPMIVQKIPEVIGQVGPAVGEAALSLITTFADAIYENLPQLFEMGMEFLSNITDGIRDSVPTFLESALPMIEQFSEMFREGAGQLVDVGIEFILNLVQGIMDSLPMLIEQVPQIIINFAGAINDNAPKLLEGGVKMLGMIITGIINSIPTLVANIPKIFEAILAVWTALNWVNLGKNVIEFIKNGIEQLSTNLPQALKDIGNKAIEWFKGVDWANAGKQAIEFIKTAILGVATHIPSTLLGIGKDAWNEFKSIDWFDLGQNVISGIVDGLRAGVDWITSAARDVAQRAKDAAKNLLDIESPSKVMRDEVGKMYDKGLAIGIEDNAEEVIRSAENLSKSLIKPFEGLEAPTLGISTESVPTNTYQADIATLIAQAIAANNEALIDRMYEAMFAAMQDGGFGIQLDGREVGRMMRESGVVMA